MTKEGKERKTLMQRVAEVQVRDPSEHAKRQVSELDKTAKHSAAKRKAYVDQMEADRKELAQIQDQIDFIHSRYDPLVTWLNEAHEDKKRLIETLEQCKKEEKRIMSETKETVDNRKMDDSKFRKRMVTMELSRLRGYTLTPESTFYQSRGNMPTLTNGGETTQGLGQGYGRTSTQSLPALNDKKKTLNRNKSSML
jgi:hypothetical protein